MPRLYFGGGVIGLLTLVLAIVAIIQIATSRLDPTRKAIWIIVVICLPLIGSLLWFLLGQPSR